MLKVLILVPVVLIIRTIISFVGRKRRSPHRPTLTCFLDALCEPLMWLKLGAWAHGNDIQTGMKLAIKRSGLNDLGTTTNFDFLKRYELVRKVGLAKSGAKFSPAGHFFIQESLTRRIEVRLQLIDYLKKHPKILDIQVKSPVFVIGFPRTGTTFLHELLGLHEGVRMHYTWEQFNPIPLTDDESQAAQTADRNQRYNKNKPYFDLMFKNLIGEEIQHIHRIGYDEPEECTIPCAFELPYALTELPFNMFATDELFPLGAGDAFVYYRKFLKLMTFQSEDRRDQDFTWMLKCPFHPPYLSELHAEFPDSTVVWTHRDPAECIASACSLHETIMRMSMEEDTIDPIALGKAVMNYTKKSLERAEETIAKLGKKFKILHIRYADNVKDSKGVCRSVLEKAGIPFTEQYEKKIDEYLANSAAERKKIKEKKGSAAVHEYKPEDYGLTTEQIHEEFKDYISKYNLLEVKKPKK